MTRITFAYLQDSSRLLAAGVIALVSGTALASVADGADFKSRIVADHLDRPQAVAPIASGTALVALQSGEILLVRDGIRDDLGPIDIQGLHLVYQPERPYTEGSRILS